MKTTIILQWNAVPENGFLGLHVVRVIPDDVPED
jgi:hypothetical protein